MRLEQGESRFASLHIYIYIYHCGSQAPLHWLCLSLVPDKRFPSVFFLPPPSSSNKFAAQSVIGAVLFSSDTGMLFSLTYDSFLALWTSNGFISPKHFELELLIFLQSLNTDYGSIMKFQIWFFCVDSPGLFVHHPLRVKSSDSDEVILDFLPIWFIVLIAAFASYICQVFLLSIFGISV